MFNDQYGLTQAVLDGRKTQTRRIAYEGDFKYVRRGGFINERDDLSLLRLTINDGCEIVAKSKYRIGEVLAVAQKYSDIYSESRVTSDWKRLPGWSNKMFVCAARMPHQIKITNIHVERLQDISAEDCMKEGIFCSHIEGFKDAFTYDATDKRDVEKWWFNSPIEAYRMLCSKLNLHWGINPLVFVYDFELVK